MTLEELAAEVADLRSALTAHIAQHWEDERAASEAADLREQIMARRTHREEREREFAERDAAMDKYNTQERLAELERRHDR